MKIYCITAKNRKSLAPLIIKKRREGWRRYRRPVNIGGAVTQMMIEGDE